MEGVLYKTTPILGAHAVFNQDLKFLPLPSLDGFLMVDVREKPTFEDGCSVGKLKISVASLINSKEVVASVTSEKGEKLTITYVAEAMEI